MIAEVPHEGLRRRPRLGALQPAEESFEPRRQEIEVGRRPERGESFRVLHAKFGREGGLDLAARVVPGRHVLRAARVRRGLHRTAPAANRVSPLPMKRVPTHFDRTPPIDD